MKLALTMVAEFLPKAAKTRQQWI